MSESASASAPSFFMRHEFGIRRVHSLLGIVPLGLYMCVHLLTNASLLNGSETFQRAVFMIHSPGELLPVIEWGGIFLPLVFHAVIGIWIAKTGHSNADRYKFVNNRRYVLQRVTGVIALVYLFFHVLHLHGWAHAHLWLSVIQPLGFGQFSPYNAASTLVEAMQGYFWPAFYLIGVMSCIYHLANGLWTAGITWGLWISAAAQERATKICTVFGLLLALVGASAWWAAVAPGEAEVKEYRAVEDRMYGVWVEAGIVSENDEKRYHAPESSESDEQAESNDENGTAE